MSKAAINDPFLRKLKARIDEDPELTVSGLALKAGLTNSVIRAWFSGKNSGPRLSTARKICAALGTTYEEFMVDAHTSEEQEIVRLVGLLPEHLRRQLLGYAQGLADAQDRARPEPPEAAE